MKRLIILLFMSSTYGSFSQELNEDMLHFRRELELVDIKIDSLVKLKENLKLKIDSIELIRFNSSDLLVLRWDYKELKEGKRVVIVNSDEDWTIVGTLDKNNYKVPTYYLIDEKEYSKKEEEHYKKEKESKEQRDKAILERKNYLIKKFGSLAAKEILNKKIWIGMTNQMTIESWGNPIDINRSVGAWGVHEQWIYSGNKYLYFENGVLKSWQD